MRITNSMMINSSLSNISINKQQMSTVDTQLSTQKKISRPSEDPIIAIRALRLRSNLSQVSQYLDKNIPDASSWLNVTQGALEESGSILQNLYQYCTQGSTDTFATSERDTIASSLQELKDAYYAQGNVDYAGRYVFTGFKTDSSLTYTSADEASGKAYTITQNFSADDITGKTVYSNTVDLSIMDDTTKTDADIASPSSTTVHRITLAYDEVSDANLQKIKYTDSTGASKELSITKTVTDPNAQPGADEVYLNTSTGEIILGSDAFSELKTAKDISFTYDKDDFAKGDVKPEHYFDCVDKSDPANPITYEKAVDGQDIEYTINFAQKLKINTEASDAFNIYLGRDVDELSTKVQNVLDIEAKQAKVKEMMGQEIYADEASQKKLKVIADELEKEHALAKDDMQKTFEAGITKMQQYQQETTSVTTDVGNRITRLNLTKTRLQDQKTNFTDLKSQNEDIDLEDVVVNYSSAELVYNASLTAASKVVRQSLLDFL